MAGSISSRGAMSSARSSHSPALEETEEPRKKGARGGKRSVTHLSKAQLARKRANDREAQRNIRQRTKEHIENLENKVKEFERGGRSSSVERIIKRNKELEAEVEMLRAQVAQTQPGYQSSAASPRQRIPEELLAPEKVTLDWMPEQKQPHSWSSEALSSHNPLMSSATNETSDAPYTMDDQIFSPPEVAKYEEADESQQQYIPNAIPIWNDPMVFSDGSQTSRFTDLQPSGFSDVINSPTFPSRSTTACWQSQPSVYAWQISTKLKAPVTFIDQLIYGVINSQRHLHITADVNGEDLIGPAFPSVNLIFGQPTPNKKPMYLTEVMARYADVLNNRGFALIPEKLASFMCMYRFIQWQISPTNATFKALYDWQAPQPSQIMIAHPPWMDLPAWPKFRDKIIRDQAKYDNVEFQNLYVKSLNLNFPYDAMKALVFEDGQIMASPLIDRHLSDLSNMSLRKAFAEKYPEFKDVCRFDEV